MIILPDMLGVKTPVYIGVKKFAALSVPAPFPGRETKYSTRKHLQSFVVVLEYVRAVLAKSEALSERSEVADDFDVLNRQVIF